MRALFVDTSAWYAMLDSHQERHHEVAAALQAAIADTKPLFTTTYVLSELYTLSTARARVQPQRFWSFLKSVEDSPSTEILHPDLHDIRKTWKLLAERSDKHYSFVDALSFHLMRRRGTQAALTLDRHFAQEGFECLPEPLLLHEHSPTYQPQPANR